MELAGRHFKPVASAAWRLSPADDEDPEAHVGMALLPRLRATLLHRRTEGPHAGDAGGPVRDPAQGS